MGLLDRFASRVTGPTTTPTPGAPVRPLTASGTRVNLSSPELAHTRHVEWQGHAWDYRDTVDELRFAAEFVANTLGQLRVYAAANRPRGEEPIPLGDDEDPHITDHTRQCAIQLVDRLNLNQQGSHLLAQAAENFDIAGECYLLGEDGDDGETWTIRSKSELVISAGGARLQDPGGGATRELRAGQCDVLRLWNPHPRWQDQPDSPVRAMLGTLEGMVLVARRGRAHDRSRISNGKALYVPWEFSLQRAGDAAEVDEDTDPFMSSLADAMMAPISDESDPSAVVPLVIRGDAMVGDRPAADVIKTVDLHGEDPANLDDRYEKLVTRFSRGINLSPERLTGLGGTNHWNGALISTDELKMHVRPRAIRLVDSLTQAYLWAGLKAMGVPLEQRRRVCLWFDPAALIENPNRDDAAGTAHAAGVISDDAYRSELGFTKEQAPTDRERLIRTLSTGQVYEASIPWVIALSGMNFEDPQIAQAISMVMQLAAKNQAAGRPSPQPRVIDAPSGPPQPGQARPVPATPVGREPAAATPAATTAAAATRKGARDDPTGPSVAGVALMAADTGRVLMLQRGLDDDKDPAAGTWEFPGGHIEDGDETSLHGGMREWAEEVGQPFPDGGTVLHTWTSADGVYQGHVVVISSEDALDLAAERTVDNADDDYSEQAAWWDPGHAAKNPALRAECKRTPWSALKRAVKTWRSPLAAAASSATPKGPPRWTLDDTASRRLAAIDRALADRLIAHTEATIGRAVERAANRIRGRAQKNPLLAAAFPPGCDPVAVVAAAGRDTQGDVTDEQAMAGALDDLAQRWTRETGHAAEQAAAVVTRMVGAPAAAGLVDRLAAAARRAWDWLRGRLQRHTLDVLYGADVDPVPTQLIRGALTLAGGVPETSAGIDDAGAPAAVPGKAATPQQGVAGGHTVTAAIRDGGAAEVGYVWGYHGVARKDPFEPHRRLDGARFAGLDDPVLATGPQDGWIGAHYYPGDHGGCLCSLEMLWATPTGEDRPSIEQRDVVALEETPYMRQVRELAEADDRAGRSGTTAQADRDAAAEIAALRRQHIGAREGGTP